MRMKNGAARGLRHMQIGNYDVIDNKITITTVNTSEINKQRKKMEKPKKSTDAEHDCAR